MGILVDVIIFANVHCYDGVVCICAFNAVMMISETFHRFKQNN